MEDPFDNSPDSGFPLGCKYCYVINSQPEFISAIQVIRFNIQQISI